MDIGSSECCSCYENRADIHVQVFTILTSCVSFYMQKLVVGQQFSMFLSMPSVNICICEFDDGFVSSVTCV